MRVIKEIMAGRTSITPLIGFSAKKKSLDWALDPRATVSFHATKSSQLSL